MRISAGKWGGQPISAPPGIRPMSEKVRQALFNVLGSVEGLAMLDAYAGSGAIGFEALSRGASQVTAVESSHKSAQAIDDNRVQLGADWGHQLYRSSVESWLAKQPSQEFDLIVADPPYAQIEPDILEKLGSLLRPAGLLVVSQSSRVEPYELKSLRLHLSKTYGDTALHFYKLSQNQTTNQA